MVQSLQGCCMPGQLGLSQRSAVLNDLTVSHARMCTSNWFLPLGPAAANVRVLKCVTEEQSIQGRHEWRIGVSCMDHPLLCSEFVM